MAAEKSPIEIEVEDKELADETSKSFEELGVDARLIRALSKKGVDKPTPIQCSAIPLILEGKDVVTRAHTGSGKTFAYLLPVLQKLFSEVSEQKKIAPAAFIVVPTRELCQQVYNEAMSLIELCRVQLKVVQFTTDAQITDLKVALGARPDILVSTPGGILKCLKLGVLQGKHIQDSLSVLILDEADLLLSFGHGNDLKALTVHIPRQCQCLLMSATISEEVETLARPLLHNPYILTLCDLGNDKDDIVSKNIQQYYIKCSSRDKLVHILALLKLELVQKKVLIFTNTIDMSFRLKLFLEQYVFNNGQMELGRLEELVHLVGKERLVLDLSCRKKDGKYAVVTDRWQKFSDVYVSEEVLDFLSTYADEFLVHGVDVEGKKLGIDEELVALLGRHSPIPVTYAGGVTVMDDLERIKIAGMGNVDVTVGSALDIFGGNLRYKDVVIWHGEQAAVAA